MPAPVLTVLSKTGMRTLTNTVAPAWTALDVVSAWKEYATVCQVEIRADRDVRIASIKEQGQVWRAFIENTFAERRDIFSRSFDMLESGLDSGDDKKISTALAMITEQIKVSPMKQAAEMMQAMSDPDVKHIEV